MEFKLDFENKNFISCCDGKYEFDDYNQCITHLRLVKKNLR